MKKQLTTIVKVTPKGLDLIEEVRSGNLGVIVADGIHIDKAIVALNLSRFATKPRSFLSWRKSPILPIVAYANWLVRQGYVEVEEKELPDISAFVQAFKQARKPRTIKYSLENLIPQSYALTEKGRVLIKMSEYFLVGDSQKLPAEMVAKLPHREIRLAVILNKYLEALSDQNDENYAALPPWDAKELVQEGYLIPGKVKVTRAN